MKKTLLLLLGLVAMTANAQDNFKLTIKLDAAETAKMYYIYMSQGDFKNPTAKVDSVAVKKGKVTYSTKLDGMEMAYICNAPMNQAKSRIRTFLAPGEKCDITMKGGDYYFGGSAFYKQMAEADKVMDPLNKDLNDYVANANKQIREAGDKGDQVRPLIMTEYNAKQKAVKDAASEYLKAHAGEAGAVMLLLNNIGPDELFATITPEVRGGVAKPYFDYLENQIKVQKERQAALAEARKKVQPGVEAMDFTLNDPDGKPLSLSSLRGKYVVLDFWGSWCGWCIKGFPEMKKSYEKYKDKMEILGVDCNDTEAKWKDAIAKYELPWKHVYNPSDSKLASDFAVSGYPTKIMIDPEGKIAKIIVGEDPAFYTYLDELFGK